MKGYDTYYEKWHVTCVPLVHVDVGVTQTGEMH